MSWKEPNTLRINIQSYSKYTTQQWILLWDKGSMTLALENLIIEITFGWMPTHFCYIALSTSQLCIYRQSVLLASAGLWLNIYSGYEELNGIAPKAIYSSAINERALITAWSIYSSKQNMIFSLLFENADACRAANNQYIDDNIEVFSASQSKLPVS